ncbi:MAG TPA: hypothetical protein VFX35_03005 [Solirubrobacterales bacterium]|nr:hypothetical protein [Solirubrobacterales bacterium]
MKDRLRRGRTAATIFIGLTTVAAATAAATVVQDGSIRVTFLAQLSPYKLPRVGTGPISVSVAGHVATVDGGIPPQLRRMQIEVNRHGLLQSRGLPVCRVARIQTATTRRALSLCAPALIGSGRFWAHIVLPDQDPYPTHGRLLIFNGREGRRHLVLAHIFTSNPFPSSFVVAFALAHVNRGRYGTALTATLPQALGDWGYVDRIKLNLGRKYRFGDRELSYFNAGCPAPKGTDAAAFPLARASFYFRGRRPLVGTVTKACGVRE